MTANAGESTCPICQRTWLVTPKDDCLMPACGCFGFDTSASNPSRPCETCGLTHQYAHEGKGPPAKMHIRQVDGVIEKHNLMVHIVETGSLGIPVAGCPGCEGAS